MFKISRTLVLALLVAGMALPSTGCEWLRSKTESLTGGGKVKVPADYQALHDTVIKFFRRTLREDQRGAFELTSKEYQNRVKYWRFEGIYATLRARTIYDAVEIQEIVFTPDRKKANVLVKWHTRTDFDMGNVLIAFVPTEETWELEDGEWRLSLVPEKFIVDVSGATINQLEVDSD